MKSRRRSKDNKVPLDGKKILLIVTGGISAYKSAYLVRLIKGSGAQVRVVMTDAATRFVTPLTFEVLSGNPVQTDIFARRELPSVEHIELARWPDRVIVAPATADFIGSVASGMAGDLPRAVVCATAAPVYMAPAMNDGMWSNPAVKRNVEILEKDGRHMIAPGTGDLACGTSGSGRMAEPEDIMAEIERSFEPGPLEGVRFLVTAGRTIEEIDPVRYISNHSSGRMGFAVAARALRLGAKVTIIHGQVDVPLPCADIIREVKSASQMKTAVLRSLSHCDVLVMAAAVSDFRPSRRAK
jgi:phosphopantothenoylcysteine decarboxylase/phosphopantothenate--cysteine ligase